MEPSQRTWGRRNSSSTWRRCAGVSEPPPFASQFPTLAAIPSVVYGLWGIFIFLPIVVRPVGVFLGRTLGFLPIFSGAMPASGISRLGAALILTVKLSPGVSAAGSGASTETGLVNGVCSNWLTN